jgi:hypothetical protein
MSQAYIPYGAYWSAPFARLQGGVLRSARLCDLMSMKETWMLPGLGAPARSVPRARRHRDD